MIRLLREDIGIDTLYFRVGRIYRRWRFDSGLMELRDPDDGERAWEEQMWKRHGLFRRISRLDQVETRIRMPNARLREFLVTTGVRYTEPSSS